MSAGGDIYGVVLNDREENDRLASRFAAPPHGAAPIAPVVYMKPRGAVVTTGGAVRADARSCVAAPTLALLMARDATGRTAADAWDCVGALALAIDLSHPEQGFHRPAVAQRCADRSLALGEWTAADVPDRIATTLDGAVFHEWSLSRLVRAPAELIAALSAFMTLKAGDILLVGLPGDAPLVTGGGLLRVDADGLLPLTATAA